VVPRIEAVVRELLADEDALVAVVEEAGVVAAILDSVVVRVDRVEVQTVAVHVANHLHDDLVRTVAVLVVVDVDTVARLGAVADHVGLDHRRNDGLRGRDGIGMRVAAPQTLLLAAEVDELHRAVERQLGEDAGVHRQTDGARTVVIGARSDRLVAVLLAGRRVDVSTDDDDLLRRLVALASGDEVVVGLAALLVGLAASRQPDGRVVLLEPGHDLEVAGAVGAATGDALGLATDDDVALAGNHLDLDAEVVGVDGGERRNDARVGSGQVGDVDGRRRREAGRVDDARIELASADVLPARVNGAEDGVTRAADEKDCGSAESSEQQKDSGQSNRTERSNK